MTLHDGSFSSVGVGRTLCRDCGIEAWNQWDEQQGCHAHEDFYVHDELWDGACPDDLIEEVRFEDGTTGRNGTYVLCIGCFEQRLGRPLIAADFKSQDPDGWYWSTLVGRRSSMRFRARLGSAA
jgi:hypothetical protein